MRFKDTKSNKIFMLIVLVIFAILFTGKGCSEREETNFTTSANNNLNIEALSADINFWEDNNIDEIKIVYNTDEDGYLEVNEKSNTIFIKEKRKDSFFHINFENGDPTISIYLPSNYNKEVQISTLSGNVEAYSNLNLEKLFISSTSGDISLLDANIENNFNIETTSGKIDGNNIIANEINIDSMSGEIEKYYLKAKDVTINEISGDIFVDTIEADNLNINSTSAEIDLYNLDINDKISINNISGDIDIKANEDEYKFDISTVSSNVKINGDSHKGDFNFGEGIPFEIVSVSGDIDIYTK